MKQIVVNADAATHQWIKKMALVEKRTMGNQVLALLGIFRATPSNSVPLNSAKTTVQPPKTKGGK